MGELKVGGTAMMAERWASEPILEDEVLRRAMAGTLTLLLEEGWPDSRQRVLYAAARSLRREWLRHGREEEDFPAAFAVLTDRLGVFLARWRPPAGARWWAGLPVTARDPLGAVSLRGRLNLLVPAWATLRGPVVVLHWSDEAAWRPAGPPPLLAVGQALLARARVGLQCEVAVTWVGLRTGRERTWAFDRASLAQGWARLRRFAAGLDEVATPLAASEGRHVCGSADGELGSRDLAGEQARYRESA